MTVDEHAAPPAAVEEVRAWFARGRYLERGVAADAPDAWFIAERRPEGLLLASRFRPYMVLVENPDAGDDVVARAVPADEARRFRAALATRGTPVSPHAADFGLDGVRGFFHGATVFTNPENRGPAPPPRDPDGWERLAVVERDGRTVIELRAVAGGARVDVSYRVVGDMKLDLRVDERP